MRPAENLLHSTQSQTTAPRTLWACTAALRLAEVAWNIVAHPQPPGDRCYWRRRPRSGSACRSRTPQNTGHRKTPARAVCGWSTSNLRGGRGYLSPGARVPLHTTLAGARVTGGLFCWMLPLTAAQRKIGYLICQADRCPSSMALAALRRALMVVVHTHAHALLSQLAVGK